MANTGLLIDKLKLFRKELKQHMVSSSIIFILQIRMCIALENYLKLIPIYQ